MPKIKEGIALSDLMGKGVEFEIGPEDHSEEEESDLEAEDKVKEAMLQFSNLDCLGTDDHNYDEEPFETIEKGMTVITPDGGVKKKVIRSGYGSTPTDLSTVKIDYNAYVEYEAEPFDSTYCRKKRQEFTVNGGEVLAGLNEAVKTMQLGEKAQFLFTPQYAYGNLGCLGRVPQNATVLFEIELHEIVNCGSTIAYEKLPEEEKNNFKEVYSYCLSLCERGKDKFQKNVAGALKDYNTAVAKLEHVQLNDYTEQEQQQKLLLRVLGNVLVCNVHLGVPKKGCMAANKIHAICKEQSMKVSAKTYFLHAKCLRMLGEFDKAREPLELARKLEPKNADIAEEYITLKKEQDKYEKFQGRLSKGLFSSPGKND